MQSSYSVELVGGRNIEAGGVRRRTDKFSLFRFGQFCF
jgi:hypothetical protein